MSPVNDAARSRICGGWGRRKNSGDDRWSPPRGQRGQSGKRTSQAGPDQFIAQVWRRGKGGGGASQDRPNDVIAQVWRRDEGVGGRKKQNAVQNGWRADGLGQNWFAGEANANANARAEANAD